MKEFFFKLTRTLQRGQLNFSLQHEKMFQRDDTTLNCLLHKDNCKFNFKAVFPTFSFYERVRDGAAKNEGNSSTKEARANFALCSQDMFVHR